MSLLLRTRYYAAECRCGWQGEPTISASMAMLERRVHERDEFEKGAYTTDHGTFTSWRNV